MAFSAVATECSTMRIVGLMAAEAGRRSGYDRGFWLRVASFAFQADVRSGQRESRSLMVKFPSRPSKSVMAVLTIWSEPLLVIRVGVASRT